jgi:hypothetical protein
MKTQITKQLLLAASLIAVTSCSFSKNKELGESAVIRFHNHYNAGQFHEIYNESDESFKTKESEANVVEMLSTVRRKLGTVKDAHQTNWHVNSTTGGTVVTLAYDVNFGEGKGTEEFVFLISGDKVLLYKYNVNSPLLITR